MASSRTTWRRCAVALLVLLAPAVALAPAATAAGAPTARVGKISYTSHQWTTSVDSPAGMAAAWDSASATAAAGYCNSGATPLSLDGLSNSALCGANSNIISHVVVPFETSAPGSWHFQIAPDYGNGSELLIDGTVVQTRWYDIYAGGDYGNTSQLFDYTADLPAGQHTIEIYGAEPCCDGSWSARYQLTTAPDWTPLQTSPPLVSVTGLPADSTVEYGSPDPGCRVDDVFDGISTPAATLSAISGPRSAAGLGTRTATCTYTDSRGLSGTVSATYTVVDTIGPTLSGVPADRTVPATSDSGASVTWPPPAATDAVDGPRPVSCRPAAGSTFPIGPTTVTCSATDLSGNTSTATFTVTVRPSATATTLRVAPGAVPAGGTATLTATVRSAAGTPTGEVRFVDRTSGKVLGETALVAGTATLRLFVGTVAGSRSVVATYPGSRAWGASSSPAVTFRVTAAAAPSASRGVGALADTGSGDSAVTFAAGLLLIVAGGLLLLLARPRRRSVTCP